MQTFVFKIELIIYKSNFSHISSSKIDLLVTNSPFHMSSRNIKNNHN